MLHLHDLRSPKGSHKRRKIVGRGPGSGHGKTSCKGQKGQTSRAGRSVIIGSEGGQMPLIKRLAKFGFRSKDPLKYQLVKLDQLTRFKEGTVINADFLKSHNLIKSVILPFKVLGDGELKKPFTIQAHSFSKSAQEKITGAGGKVEIVKVATN